MNSAHSYSEGAEVPEDKTKDNELIAQFMGFEKNGNHYHKEGREIYQYFGDGYGNVFPDEFAFDHNWSWLMPVVDTIEEIEEPHPSNNPEKGTIWPYQFEILSRSIVQIIDNRNDNAIVTINQDGLTKIQAVYKAVVEFIKWYNLESLKNKPI